MTHYLVSLNGQVHIPFDTLEEARACADDYLEVAAQQGLELDVYIITEEVEDEGTDSPSGSN